MFTFKWKSLQRRHQDAVAAHRKKIQGWHRYFVWWPTTLDGGQTIWGIWYRRLVFNGDGSLAKIEFLTYQELVKLRLEGKA